MKLFRNSPFRVLSLAAVCGALLGAPSLRAESYTIFIFETDAALASRSDAARGPAYWAAFAAFGNQLKEAGVLRGGSALRASEEARTVVVRDGQTKVTNGAWAKAPLPLGGYFTIDVPTLAEAISWASRAPNFPAGVVEVRPAFPAPGM
jgi:hypothetical protein